MSESMYVNINAKTEKSVTQGDITVTITAGKVENGFVVTKRVSGRRPMKDNPTETEYFEEGKSYISTKCPFEEEEEGCEGKSKDKEVQLPNIKSLLDTYASIEGKMLV